MEKSEKLIDFHAHILPGLDHGCRSVDTAVKQLEIAALHNVGTIVASSHFYPHIHNVEDFLKNRENAYESVKGYAETKGIEIVKGAEVQLCTGLYKMKNLERLCVDNTNVMLLEIPDMPMTRDMYETLEKLSRSFDVLIAHVERYSRKVRERLVDDEYKLQVNAYSMFCLFALKNTNKIIDFGNVYALGSDIHGDDASAYKYLEKAQKKINGKHDEINLRMRELLNR